MADMTRADWERVIDYELKSAFKSMWRIAEALWNIHQGNEYGKSFERYCNKRWGFSRKRGYDFVKAWATQQRSGGIMQTVDQAAALAKVPTEDLKWVVHDATSARKARDAGQTFLENKARRKRRRRIARILKNAKGAAPMGFRDWVTVSKGKDGFEWMNSLPAHSVDLILTDPLWTVDKIEEGYPKKLGVCAKRLLRKHGLLAVMVGGIKYYKWIEGVVNEVKEDGEEVVKGVPYRWTIPYIPCNPYVINGRPESGRHKRVPHYNVASMYKPVLVFGSPEHHMAGDVVVVDTERIEMELATAHAILRNDNDKATLGALMDGGMIKWDENTYNASSQEDKAAAWRVIEEDVLPYKHLHPFAQSKWGFRELVNLLSLPGQTVIDPFCGTGATLCAGIEAHLGMRVVKGNDLDEQTANFAELNCRTSYWAMQNIWKHNPKPKGWQ